MVRIIGIKENMNKSKQLLKLLEDFAKYDAIEGIMDRFRITIPSRIDSWDRRLTKLLHDNLIDFNHYGSELGFKTSSDRNRAYKLISSYLTKTKQI